MARTHHLDAATVQHYAADGAVVLRGVFNAGELALLERGIEHNLAHLSPLALVASVLAMRWSYFLPFEGVGAMWPQVIATLAAYHAFLVVLVAGWFVRGRLYRAR